MLAEIELDSSAKVTVGKVFEKQVAGDDRRSAVVFELKLQAILFVVRPDLGAAQTATWSSTLEDIAH
jgi:hypothetical protein